MQAALRHRQGYVAVKNLSNNVPLLPYSRIVWVRCRRVAAGDSDPAQGKATEAPMTVSLTGKEWAAAMVVKQESEAAEKPKKKRKKKRE